MPWTEEPGRLQSTGLQREETSLLLMTPYLKLHHGGTTKRHSRVRRKTAVIGGLYTIVLLIELEHFVGVPSIRLEKEGECFKAQQGKQ